MPESRRKPRPSTFMISALFGAALVACWPLLPTLIPDEQTYLFVTYVLQLFADLFAVVGLACAAHVASKHNRRVAGVWAMLSLARLFWLAGDATDMLGVLWLGQDRFPDLVYNLFVGYYIAFTIALIMLPTRKVGRAERLRGLIDQAIICLVAVVFFWSILISPASVATAGRNLMDLLKTAAGPISDLLLLTGLVILIMRGIDQRRLGPWVLLLAALGILILGDVIWARQVIADNFRRGTLLDVGWLAAGVLTGLSGIAQLRASQKGATELAPRTSVQRSQRWAQYLPYFCVPPVLLSVLVRAYRGELALSLELMGTLVGSLILLVVSRQILLLAENGRLNDSLAAELNERIEAQKSVQQLNAELEQRVQDRTQALSKANQELGQEIVERHKAEVALRESRERYALAAQGANDGLWDWDLTTDQVYYSPRWKAMLGYEPSDLGHAVDAWFGRVHPLDAEHVRLELDNHLYGHTDQFQSEHRVLHKDGDYRWMLARGIAIRDQQGRATRIAGSQTDITDRKRAEEQLLQNAFYDALTGLPNRALFVDRLSRAIQHSQGREQSQFAVLYLDFDRFKIVNDSLGHPMGDQLLIQAAKRLSKCVRAVDTAARLSGDEFVLLIEDVEGPDDAIRVAERVQDILRQPFVLDGHEVFCSASTGIVMSTPGVDADGMLRDADIALYRAKGTGRARYVIFDPDMHLQASQRLEMETDIRRGLEREEFVVHYQPIVSLETHDIIGFEALVRWQHPSRGLLSPAEFLPIAEETGLITAIDRCVLAQACRQMQVWQQSCPVDRRLTVSVSVNLSSPEFLQPDLVQHVAQALRETGLPACCLRLEITESVIMGDAKTATEVLLALRDLGVQVQIDDFGTGYSSLSYLQQFPISTIKIDRSFISRIDQDDSSAQIVNTIVSLAHSLGLNATAEGVETEHQMIQLKGMACEFGQGYHIARPMDARAATMALAEYLAEARPGQA